MSHGLLLTVGVYFPDSDNLIVKQYLPNIVIRSWDFDHIDHEIHDSSIVIHRIQQRTHVLSPSCFPRNLDLDLDTFILEAHIGVFDIGWDYCRWDVRILQDIWFGYDLQGWLQVDKRHGRDIKHQKTGEAVTMGVSTRNSEDIQHPHREAKLT